MKIENGLKIFFVLLCVFVCVNISAQDFGFGFGSEDNSESSASSLSSGIGGSALSLKTSGEINMELSPYIKDFDKQEISFWDMVSGTLNFSASNSSADAIASFNISADSINRIKDNNSKFYDPVYTPLINEAYLRAYIGPVNIEAGLRKLTWGKMDSPGPLDVTNPMDYTDFRYITDTSAIKIARPMLHVTLNTSSFSKIEGVFIPNFVGHRFAADGRWQPSQFRNMYSTVETGFMSKAEEKFGSIVTNPAYSSMFDNIKNNFYSSFDEDSIYPSTADLKNFQAGLRFTGTIGSADIGVQYFFGHLFRPGFTIAGVDAFIDDLESNINGGNFSYPGNTDLVSPEMKYNRYHQIGIDYAQVLLGFNVRAEFAANITYDIKGSDGSVYNPALLWALGFDRDLFWGINLNLQCNESIRLMNGKVGNNPILDVEAGTKMTDTRIIAVLSKKFFRDELEVRVAGIVEIEARDYLILPSFIWTKDAVAVELSGGIFGGDKDGQFGQYSDNKFVKVAVTYSF